MKQTSYYLLLLAAILFSQCKNSEKENAYYQTNGEIFKTFYHIKYNHTGALAKEIREELQKVDLSLNPFNKESIIYKVNQNEDVEVDSLFITVFGKAQEIAALSGGRYDITVAPLINLWGFGFEKMGEATPVKVDSLKQFVGYEKVRLEGRRVVKDDPRLQLNASSIAKGYACDVVAQLFNRLGVNDYMIEIGGEVVAKGKNMQGECWRIQINKPVDDATGTVNERMEVLPLCDKALATSGNYRNFYKKDGKKYAHTIDPTTGYPCESNILSATVIADDCMTADALATMFMTVDLDTAIQLATKFPGISYYFVYQDNGELKSKAL